jgi:hypothetical protein
MVLPGQWLDPALAIQQAVRGSRMLKAGIRAAAAWFKSPKVSRVETPKGVRLASGLQVRCAKCVDGTRSCVYCFGHGHTLAVDGVAVPCEPCRGKGRVRCHTCKGQSFVARY